MKKDLKDMTTAELTQLMENAKYEIERKNSLRAKELWGNVVAAINKYQGVTGRHIVLFGDYAKEYQIGDISTEEVGRITLGPNNY